MILEKAVPNWKDSILKANSFLDIADIFKTIFNMDATPGQEPPETPEEYKNENSDYGLKVKGIKARERLNEQAREIIDRIKDPKDLTEKEKDILKQYSGRGGLTENSQFEYYTPTPVAEGLWDALKENGFQNGNVLDPCTGAGIFPATKPKGTVITGADIDPVGSKVAQLLNPGDSIKNQSFEKTVMETPDDTFDAVVGNVPFGSARGASAHEDPAYKDEKRIERYFILRVLDKAKPGGLVCLVVPTNIVGAKGSQWEKFRIAISKKAEFLGAHKLPSKTFGAQGTDTVVDIVVFKKHSRDFLDRLESIPFDTLKSANVVWEPFIGGQYWLGEGKPFIMGKWVPKIEGDRWSRETVDGDIDNAGMKAKLAQRFNSRVDWDALEAVEPIVRNYANGDRKIINGCEYELVNGIWQKVLESKGADAMAIDATKYGAASIAELKDRLASPKSALGLSAQQTFAAYKSFPELLTPLQRASIEFAMSQAKDEHREQIYRGSIIGGMIARYQNSLNDGTAEDAERIELQEMVAKEISTYGHPKNNKKLLLTGESSKMFGLFKNAVDEKGQFSDLLAGTIEGSGRALEYDSTNTQAIVEHLFVRENIQDIELEDFKKLYTGKREINSLADLAGDDAIAITPDGMIMPMSRYAAGDIYPKIQAMSDALALEADDRIKAKYMKQIDEIMRRRKTTKPEDIIFGMRQKWFSRKYVVDFLREHGYPEINYGSAEGYDKEDPYSGKISKAFRFKEDYDNPFGQFSGINEKGGFPKQFIDWLNGGNVTSSGEDAQERIKDYKDRCRIMEEQFNAWMQQHTDTNEITEQYNRKFNGYTPFDYDESDLGLTDVSPEVKLHGYQNSGVRRLSEEGRGILAHNVGLGKTFAAMALYSYNLKLGRSKKTCIVVPKSVLGNWYHESKKFLGHHNGVLFVGFEPKKNKDGVIEQETVKDEQGNTKINKFTNQAEYQDIIIERNSKEDIWEAMWKIPQANYSLVVMSKEKFGMIPMRPASKQAFTEKMVSRSLISEKMAAAAVGGNSPTESKEGEKKVSYNEDVGKTRLEQQFSDEGTAKKDELPYLEDMGFTDVVTDECHSYKNNLLGGEHYQQVAYLPTAPTAKIALDMTMKMNYMREANNGRGVYMLSATPVTNSPFEIFNMLSYVCPIEEFERYGIYTPDDFIRVFGNITPVDKMMVDGSVKSKDGLTGFQNLDGLRSMFHKYVNMKSAEDFPDQIKLPPHEEVNLDVELTEEQKTAYSALRDRASDAAKPPKKGEGKKESMFSVIRDMDRVTTDMDLYNKTMTFIFRKTDKDNAEALIASLPKSIKIKRVLDDEEMDALGLDPESTRGRAHEITIKLEITKKMEGDGYVVVFPKEYENLVVDRVADNGIVMENVSHPLMPKYAKLIDNLRIDLETNGKQLIFTEEKSQHQKILRLIVHHIPTIATLIGIINADEAQGGDLQKISDSYNSGNLKFVICNKKAEVGVNLQRGTTAIHHLTLPWTPASIQQRNGRGVRQGNTAANIKIYYYCGKGSFDTYRLEILKAKSNWMRDLFDGSETTAENANALSRDEMMDMLEADPEAAKRRRMERLAEKQAGDVQKEKRRLANQLQILANATAALNGLESEKKAENDRLAKRIPELEAEIKRLQERGLTAEGDERARLGSQIISKQQTLKNCKTYLESIDKTFEDKRARLTSTSKQTAGLLKQKAKNGQLPFDESLIDKPGNACVSLSGKVVAIGDCYEGKDEYRQYIIKITKVDAARRAFQYDDIIGGISQREMERMPGDWGWWAIGSLETLEAKGLTKVSYSEKELNLKKALSEEHGYDSLIEGKIDKETFLDHRNEINWNVRESYLLRDESGVFIFSESGHKENNDFVSKIIYPEPANEDFKKGVCMAYLALKRSADGRRLWDVDSLMRNLFGDQWDTTAQTYGTVATEGQIKEACAKTWKEYVAKEYENADAYIEFMAKDGNYRDIKNDIDQAFDNAVTEANKLGDNEAEIREAVKLYFDALKESLIAKVTVAKSEQDKASQEALKNDPRYKDIPTEVRDAFARLGITVKTNSTSMTLPGFKGRRGTVVSPFAKWFFQDKSGKSGVLFRTKDILKERYGAQFFSDAGGAFEGAWWHVPSTVDLKSIYELLG